MDGLSDFIRKARKLARLVSAPVYRRGLLHGVAAAVEHAAVVRAISPRTILDVGANRGQFSLLALREAPWASIYAFEPLLEAANCFDRLMGKFDQVKFFRTALACDRGVAKMHVSGSSDSSSLLEISSLQMRHFPGTEEVGTEEVPIGALSDFISSEKMVSPSLLKIDVQGGELGVLKSATALFPNLDWIYVEASFVQLYEGQPLADEVVAYLAEFGFAIQGVHNVSYAKSGKALQADFLFGRAAAAESEERGV